MRRAPRPEYSPPAIDSDAALNAARNFLFMATDKAVAEVTAEQVATRHRLSAKVAEYELGIARKKRGIA